MIIRAASNSALSSAKIKYNCGVDASLATVKRVIKSAKHLKRLKIKKNHSLMIRFAWDHIAWVKQWSTVVFSEEKKFNLDGPDSYNYYFHDLRKEERFLNPNHSCVGAISYYGTCQLLFVSSKMNAITYKGVIEKAFQHFDNIFGPIPWTFQHYNAPISTPRAVKQWISGQNVQLLEWPSYSPELNIIENVWKLLSRKAYEGGRQFEKRTFLRSL